MQSRGGWEDLLVQQFSLLLIITCISKRFLKSITWHQEYQSSESRGKAGEDVMAFVASTFSRHVQHSPVKYLTLAIWWTGDRLKSPRGQMLLRLKEIKKETKWTDKSEGQMQFDIRHLFINYTI